MKGQLRIGSTLKIFNQADRRHYKAEVRGIAAGFFIICPPVWGEKELPLSPGSWWPSCLIGADALYYFKARVLGSCKIPSPGYIVQKPGTVRRLQRREYVRVSCSLNATYRAVDEISAHREGEHFNEIYPAEGERGEPAVVVDLSGGGLKMVTREFISPRSRLIIYLYLENEAEGHRVEGRVVRVVPITHGSWKRYRIGVMFKTNSQFRERIIRYLFTVMQRRIRDCYS